jgi:hypothetical protein
MGKSQKKRLLEAHARTMKKWLLIPYKVSSNVTMLHVESR